MADLDPRTRAALRSLAGPSAPERAEMLASIWARLDGGPDGSEGGDGSSLDPSSTGGAGAGADLAWIAKVVGATAGLSAAGLLALGLVGAALSSPAPSSPEPRLQARPGATLVDEREPPSRAAEAPREPPAPELPGPPARTSPGPERGPNPRASLERGNTEIEAEAAATPSEARPDDLRAELALLHAAEALAASQPAAALAKLDRHRDEFPSGALAPEREVLRIEVLCALGRDDDAARAAASARDRYDDAPLRERITASCAGQ